MERHILSYYSRRQSMSGGEEIISSDKTLHTDSTELSDPDEFKAYFSPTTQTFADADVSDLDEFMLSNGPTNLTEEVEGSDAVDFMSSVNNGPTLLTETVESSDPDEFIQAFQGTIRITKSVESTDPDEFRMSGATLETRAVETSDPDEFMQDRIDVVNKSDFDSFLV